MTPLDGRGTLFGLPDGVSITIEEPVKRMYWVPRSR
jgi:hypothetical protein